MSARYRRTGIVISLILALLVMMAIALYADIPQMFMALTHFRWAFLPLILGFTLFNYLWRFIKWQYYLKRLKIHVRWGTSLLIFLSGLSMAITPGKVGELLKSYLLKHSTGVAISRTAPIIVAERLTDGIAMLILASVGLILYHFGGELLLILLIICLTGIMSIQNRSFAFSVLNKAERLPGMSRITLLIRTFYESSYTLPQWQPLLLAIGIGILSCTGECVALYFVFQQRSGGRQRCLFVSVLSGLAYLLV